MNPLRKTIYEHLDFVKHSKMKEWDVERNLNLDKKIFIKKGYQLIKVDHYPQIRSLKTHTGNHQDSYFLTEEEANEINQKLFEIKEIEEKAKSLRNEINKVLSKRKRYLNPHY